MFGKRHLRVWTPDTIVSPTSDLEDDVAAFGFAVKQDDFSLQIYSSSDRFFWIRIDRDAPDLEVTDLNPGDLAANEVAVALAWAIRLAGHEPPGRILIRDIAPNGDTGSRLMRLRTILSALASSMDDVDVTLEVLSERKKVNVVATFTGHNR